MTALVELFENPGYEAQFRIAPDAGPGPQAFHRRLPGYCPSPLYDVAALATAGGVGRVLVKDESDRFGLPAFKMLGASWASYQALVARLEADPASFFATWTTLDELAALVEPLRPLDLATATDGNHGRAVARFARWLGFGARIFVPAGTTAARIEAIEGEGASCTVVDGTYDDAVATAAKEAAQDCIVVSDTSWPGYDTVPRDIIEGYTTIFAELDAQLAAAGLPAPDVVLVPIGVGALAAAVARFYRGDVEGRARPVLVGIEPTTAACMQASARAGRLVEVPGPHRSIMAGLNCGEASPVAWPIVQPSYEWFAAVDDDVARDGMRVLAASGIVGGESGACTAGLLTTWALDLPTDAVVLVLSTEGATDPGFYAATVGAQPREIASRAPACAAGGDRTVCSVPGCPSPCRPSSETAS